MDGAQGGQDATRWTSPEAKTWSVVDDRLRPAGVKAVQVQAIWLKQAQARPWIGWGPYLWTDRTKGRSDGFTWSCEDAAQDGAHPSQSGRMKVAKLLQQFLEESEFIAWHRLSGAAGSSASPPPIEDHSGQ